MKGGELDAEIVTALDLDSIIGSKAHSTTTSRATCEATSNILYAEQTSLETPLETISGKSTPMPAKSGKGFSLLPLHAPSFGRDIENLFLKSNRVVSCVLMLN